MVAQAIRTDNNLARIVEERCGENAYLCYSCKKCSAGCPLSDYMDLTPAQLMRAIQFGQAGRVLNSKTLWLCAYCETCVTRCPHGIDTPLIMDTLKGVARERGVKPKLPSVEQFNELALRSINTTGRVYELGVMAGFNLFTGQILKDAALGAKMFKAGKLKLLPQWVRYSKPSKRTVKVADTKKVAFYPGCSLHASGIEYGISMHAVAHKLGIELEEVKNWTCCGAAAAHAKSRELATVMPMRTVATAEADGYEKLTTPCPACFSRLKTAVHTVEKDARIAKAVAADTGYEYQGQVKIDNIVTTFIEEVGLDAIGKQVVKPLKDLKVVCYYGCLMTRPPEITGAEHAEYPMTLDNIVTKLGATVLDWSYKTDCCGASLMLTQTGIALDLSQKLLDKAKEVGAEAIVVACSFCQANLENRQGQIENRSGKKYNLPVMYFTQMMGLAFGMDPKELGLDKLFVSPVELLKSKELL